MELKHKTFLQSSGWEEFQKKMGNKAWRLPAGRQGIDDVLAIKILAKRGTFLQVQHSTAISKELVEQLKKIAKEEKCSFIRMAPLMDKNEENEKLFKNLGFREASMHANAYEATWKLDLSLPDDELLANMRKTTRYLIKQAQKNKDIVIRKSDKGEDLKIYQNLNREVASRQKFTAFSDEYIKNEFEAFVKNKECLLFFGEFNREIAAGALIIFWEGIGFYHQAASLNKYAKLSIPYLLQWEAIKEAKRRWCEFYDFWGYTDPKKYPKHPWAGPTLFKMGFGGRAYEYMKTQDLPISKKYYLTSIFEKLRKTKRGL